MTLPPIDTWQVRGVAGPKYKVGPHCANPTCSKLAEHAHHMWRRSFLAGDFAWVELPDGHVVGNLVGLCPSCHDKVTGRIGGHTAAIRMGDPHLLLAAGMTYPEIVFWWCTIGHEDSSIEYEFVAPLEPQPPTLETVIASPAESGSDSCPTCGQPKPRQRPSSTPAEGGRRRRRKTWPVKVPADHEENGAEVLDDLVETLAPLLGVKPDKNGTYTSGRYYVLVPSLFFCREEKESFVNSILGVD